MLSNISLLVRSCFFFNSESLPIKNSGVTSYTFYRGLHSGVTPKYAGKLARALDVDVEEIIIMED